jgi:hypothetical protein
MMNVTRDERIDKRVDRLTGPDAAPDFGGGNGDGGVVGEDDCRSEDGEWGVGSGR